VLSRNFVKNFRFFGRVLMLIASGYLLFPVQALPLPTGANVVAGQSQITTSGNQMTITQTTDKAIINWQGYSIDLNEIVKYIQPNANSISLNRVVGIDPSIILGQLIANGRVWIVNPNGIFFGKDAVINVSGILASTLNIKDSDFLSGKYEFTQDSNSALSSIINKGQIIINDNGYAILVAPLVSNEGLIVANLGKVIIAGSENFVVNFDGNNLINFTISKTSQTPGTVLIPSSQVTNIIREVVNTPQIIEAGSIIEENGNTYLVGASGTVINTGTIKADGAEGKNAGTIILNSNQATVVARGSLISASGVGENSNGGEIRILSDMSSGFTGVGAGATLEAKGGQTGDGGFIEISGNKFQTWGNIDVSAENGKAGTFLLDPTDIYIRDSAVNTQDYDDTGNNFPDYGGMGLAFGTADNDADLDGTSNEIASGYLTSLSGTIVLQATNDIIIDQITVNPLDWTIPGTTANLVLQAGRHIQFSNAGPFTINTNGGFIILEADSPHYLPSYDGIGTIDLGQVTLQTGGGNVTLIAANFNFPAIASINAGSGNVYIAHSVDGTPLGLGSVAGAQLTDAELDIITTTGTVTIGQATTAGDDGQGTNAQTLTAGTITVDDLNPANFQNLVFVGSTIGDGANDTGVTVTSLTLYTSGSIGTGVDPLNINVGNLTVATSGTGNVTIYEADAITLSSISTFDGTIDITSGGPMTATSVSTGNNKDIYLTTLAGDLVAGSINAGTGNVYLEANNNILDDANDTTVVKGNYISLIANNGGIGTGINGPIDIDLGSGTLTLTSFGSGSAGDILVDETSGDLNLSRINITTDNATTQIIEIRNTDGNIIIDTAYGVGNDVLYLATTNVAGRDISFTGSGSITTNATVILNSSDEILGNPASGIDISAAAVELVAVNGIGSTNPIETAVSDLSANNTNSNNINITNNGPLTITMVGGTNGVINSGGNVNITTSSPLTVNSPITAAGNITLTASGSSSMVTADDLTLNANVTSTVAGSTITLNAGDAINQTSGSVSITGGGTIIATADTEGDSGADGQNAGFTQSAGTSFVSSGASAGPITVSAYDNITINLLDAGSADVNVTSTNGAIDSVNYDGAADVIGGTINLIAASGGIGTSSILEVAASTALNADTTADNSDILIDSIGNLPVGLVNAGTGDVTLNATGYAITDANGGANNITATNLILIATNGIGSGDALETTVTNLDATNTDNNIEITNTGALTLVDLTSDTYSVINTNGSVNIAASSPLTVNSDVVAGGDITLTASGSASSGDNLTLNANVTSTGTGTTITLNAGDDIIQNIGSVSITGGGTIIATADTEGDSGADTDDAVFTQATGTSFVSNGGNITVSSYGNATIALLDAGYPSGGDVSVTSTNGSILDSDSGTVPADYDIKGHNVTLNAYGDIGSSAAGGEIDIQMDGILTLTAGGSAYLGFYGDVILGAISANNLTLTATGNILDDELATGGGDEDGATGDWTLVNITNNLNLTAGGRIGTDHNPNDRDMDAGYLDIDFGNTASFTAVDGLYLNFDVGTLDTSTLTFNTPGTGIEVIMVSSSGDIFYNGFASAPNIAKENLIMAANGDFYLNSDLLHGLTLSYEPFLGIFATGDVYLNANIVSLNGDINIAADFESGYLGILRDGVGAITQSNGKIVWVADDDNGLILEAGSGISGATGSDPLDTEVRNLIAYNTLGSGDIIISNTGTLNIVKDMPSYAYGVYNPVGNVYIETASPLNIIAPVVSSGAIFLVANGTDGDINLNLSNTGAYIQSTGSFIELMAGKDVNVNGNITAEDDVYIAAYRNIDISGGIITSGNNDYIYLIADAGSNNTGLINQTGGKVGNDSVTGNITNLVLRAANGINLTNTDITYLQAINTTTGNIEITNTGSDSGIYTMGNGVINNASGGNIKITSLNPVTIEQPVTATGGNIEISSVNDFQINNIISTTGSGTITLTATGANGYISLYPNSKVQSDNGDITLNADSYVQLQKDSLITSTSGDIEINSTGAQWYEADATYPAHTGAIVQTGGTGTITLNSGSSIGQSDGARIISEDGDITLNGWNITLSNIQSDSGRVTINANGYVRHSGSTFTDVVAPELVITAKSDIGGGGWGPITTDVNYLSAYNDTSLLGHLVIENTGDLELRDLAGWGYAVKNTSPGGWIIITANSNLTVSEDVIGYGHIVLNASENFIQNAGSIITPSNVYINADYDGSGSGYINQIGGSIAGNALRALSSGYIKLTGNTNDVNYIAVNSDWNNNGVSGNVQIVDADDITVGTVYDIYGSNPVSGITTNGSDITLTTINGYINVSEAITTGGTTSGKITLTTGETDETTNAPIILSANITGNTIDLSSVDGINQTSGVINAVNLRFNAGDSVSLSSVNNDVDIIAGETSSGDIQFMDKDDLIIGTVLGTTGIIADSGNIGITSGGQMTVNKIVAGGSGDITLKTYNSGDVLLGTVTAREDDVTIISAGAIIDNNADTNNITALNLILDAATGIGSGNAIETQVSNLAARVKSGTATGNIEIDNTGDLTLGNLAGWGEAVRNFGSGNINILVHSNLAIEDPIMTAGGDIILTANSGAIIQNATGDITTYNGNYRAIASGPYIMADGAFVNTGSGLIDIDAGGNITLGQLISTSTVYLNSGGAIIDITGDTNNPDISAAAVEFIAVNGIGTATDAIDTSVADLSAVTANGQIYINQTGNLAITGVGITNGISVTNGGPIWINTNGGSLTLVNANQDIKSNGGPITILAGAVTQNNGADIISSGGNINMTIASLTQNESSKIEAGTGNVTINATGNILLDEINGYTVDIRTTGGNIEEQTPDTQRDITATNLILVAANGIGSNNTLQTDVSYLNAYNTSSGNINIDNAGDLTIDNFAGMGAGYGVYNESGSVFIDVDGSINIPGTYGDGVYANDNVTLIASGDITAGSDNWITAVRSENGNATLSAGNNIYLGQNYYSDIYADGDINLTAGNDITIDNYTYVESYDGDITIDAGRDINLITRAIDEETLISADSGYLSLNAGRDININGGPSYVSTYSYDDTEIYAGNDINIIGGDIYADYGYLDIEALNNVSIIASEIIAENNYLDIYAYNNVNIINTSTYSSGNTTIEAETGDVVIDPAGNIPESEIISDENIEITAGNNIIVLGSQVIAGDSAYLTAGNDIQIGYVEAVNTVSMEAGGSIYDNNQEGMNIVATNLVLLAGKGIGNHNGQIDPIETSVSNLQAGAEDGDIYIDNTGDLNLVDINSLGFAVAANGDIEIKTTNDMTISGLVEATGSVYLYAIDGGIIDNNTATPYDIIAGKTSGLYAGNGTIGIKSGAGWFDPLEVNITGDLYVYASDEYNLVSVAIDGIVNPRDMLSTRSDWGVPPGLIIFNGRVNGGGESERLFRATGNAIHYIGIEPYIYETLMLYIIDPSYFEPAPEYWDLQQFKKAIEGMASK